MTDSLFVCSFQAISFEKLFREFKVFSLVIQFTPNVFFNIYLFVYLFIFVYLFSVAAVYQMFHYIQNQHLSYFFHCILVDEKYYSCDL